MNNPPPPRYFSVSYEYELNLGLLLILKKEVLSKCHLFVFPVLCLYLILPDSNFERYRLCLAVIFKMLNLGTALKI